MTFWERRQQAEHLRGVALDHVLPLCDARPDNDDKHKWHTPEGVLSVNGPKFMNWNCGIGGGGAIDLVIHLKHFDFKTAVDWLAEHFPGVAAAQALRPTSRSTLRLPTADTAKLPRVREYLVRHRAIAPALLEPLIQAGALYADDRANAVFLLLGKENLPVGAELRGTTARSWRGLAAGSQKDLGFFAVPLQRSPDSLNTSSPLILCESAIDALSCFALYPQYRCLSTAGARPNPPWLKPLLEHASQICCGFDADPTGDAMAAAMIALHPVIKRLRPAAHDWNDLLKASR